MSGQKSSMSVYEVSIIAHFEKFNFEKFISLSLINKYENIKPSWIFTDK